MWMRACMCVWGVYSCLPVCSLSLFSLQSCIFSINICVFLCFFVQFRFCLGSFWVQNRKSYLYPWNEFESYVLSENVNFHIFCVNQYQFGKNLIFATRNSQWGIFEDMNWQKKIFQRSHEDVTASWCPRGIISRNICVFSFLSALPVLFRIFLGAKSV